MKYSIIVITFNRPLELFKCLISITQNISYYPHEVIVIFNGERSTFEKCKLNFKEFKILFIEQTTPANARNFAIKESRGEYLFFLDDDCILPPNYFNQINFNGRWDVLGGPDQTPLHSSPLQVDIGRALSSPLCMGPTYKRHTRTKNYVNNSNEESLILCNLWFQASLFHQEGFTFNGRLFRNEENYLLKELKSNFKIIHYNPALFVYHQRKQNMQNLWKAVSKSGECRVLNFLLLPNMREAIYILPLVWLMALLIIIVLPNTIILLGFGMYTLSIIAYYVFQYRSISLQYIFLHYFILTAYAVGLVKGLVNWRR